MGQRVLILPSWYPSVQAPLNGVFVRDQARVLAGSHSVAVLAPEIRGWRPQPPREPATAQIEAPDEKVAFVTHRVVGRWPLARLAPLAYAAFYWAAARGVAHLLRVWGRPDVIHAHVVLPAGMAAAALGRQLKVPVVLTEHSGPFAVHCRTAWQRALVRATLAQVDRVVAVSPALAEAIQVCAPTVRPDIVGNLVDTAFFTPAEPRQAEPGRRFQFLTIGLLTAIKGVDLLLHAAAQVAASVEFPFEVIIGGDGPERPALERLAAHLGLAGRCRFLGALSRPETRAAMQACDVFVLASRHETFGLVVAEAIACGRPILATRSGGPEFVMDAAAGRLVPSGDGPALAAGMRAFLMGEVPVDGVAARRSLEARFSPAAILDQLTALYQQVTS